MYAVILFMEWNIDLNSELITAWQIPATLGRYDGSKEEDQVNQTRGKNAIEFFDRISPFVTIDFSDFYGSIYTFSSSHIYVVDSSISDVDLKTSSNAIEVFYSIGVFGISNRGIHAFDNIDVIGSSNVFGRASIYVCSHYFQSSTSVVGSIERQGL